MVTLRRRYERRFVELYDQVGDALLCVCVCVGTFVCAYACLPACGCAPCVCMCARACCAFLRRRRRWGLTRPIARAGGVNVGGDAEVLRDVQRAEREARAAREGTCGARRMHDVMCDVLCDVMCCAVLCVCVCVCVCVCARARLLLCVRMRVRARCVHHNVRRRSPSSPRSLTRSRPR